MHLYVYVYVCHGVPLHVYRTFEKVSCLATKTLSYFLLNISLFVCAYIYLTVHFCTLLVYMCTYMVMYTYVYAYVHVYIH